MSHELAIYVILVSVGALVALTAVGLVMLREAVGLLRVLADRPRPKTPPSGKAVAGLFVVTSAAWATSPADAVAAAHADAKKLPAKDARYTRYLSVYHVRDAKRQGEWKAVADFWLNSLSRENDLVLTHPVGATLFRLDLRNYQIDTDVWEKLAAVDPYFHADLEVVKEKPGPVEYEMKVVPWEGGIWPGDGKNYARGAFSYEKKVAKKPEVVRSIEGSPAPWLNQKTMAELVKLTDSAVPIVRADWFVAETGQQDERNGTGYYDFLKVKTRDDWFDLVALDRKLAEKRGAEVRAIIPISGVANNNRAIVRLQSIFGGTWLTLDTERKKRKIRNETRNVARRLNGDLVHDAEEGYGPLGNGLFAFWAGNAAGVRQDSVPPQIATAGPQATGNDGRIHPFTCVKCHKEGIRPLDDWGRRVYQLTNSLVLAGPDFEKQKRLQRLYLSELQEKVTEDQTRYARALFRVSGMTPAAMATTFGKLHEEFLARPLGLQEIADEYGTTKQHLQASLMTAATDLARRGKSIDPSFAALLIDPPVRMRREYHEELFPAGMGYIGGVIP